MSTITTLVQHTPGKCGGAACIRDTRIAVWALIERWRNGRTDED